MDYKDIYKKLTRGCKIIPTKVKKQKRPNPKIEKELLDHVEVKEEITDQPHESDTEHQEVELKKRGKKRKQNNENEEEYQRKQKLLKIEEVNHYRNMNMISVVGARLPDPIRSFEELPIGPDMIEILNRWGYYKPTPIQQQAIPVMMEGRNILACAPTGSGKTVAFLVPLIHELKQPEKDGFRALILCPTRELVKQTLRECLCLSESKGLKVHVIKGSKKLTRYGPNSSQKYDILITTPNRLCYLLNQDPPVISFSNLKWLVIDEADKLFEAGACSFRKQLDDILAASSNSERKIAMFGATQTPVVTKWCVHNTKGLARVTVGHRNTAVTLVDQELLYCGFEKGKLIGLRNIIREGFPVPALIFVQSKERAQELFRELLYDELNVDAIHADRTQQQRDDAVQSFHEGKIWVLICTELMARGVDFRGVNLVINYDFPPSAISYIHRIGRAGRAGHRGKAITFWTDQDKPLLRSIARVIKDSGGNVPEFMLQLKKESKKERKQLENRAPKRETISTHPRRRRNSQKKKEKNKSIEVSKQDSELKIDLQTNTEEILSDTKTIKMKNKKSRARKSTVQVSKEAKLEKNSKQESLKIRKKKQKSKTE